MTGGMLLGIITSIILSRWLGPDRMGQYGYFLWVLSIAALFTHMGLPNAAVKFGAEYLGKKQHNVAASIVWQLFTYEFLLGLLVWGLLGLYTFLLSPPQRLYWLLIGLSILPFTLATFALAASKGTQDYRFVAQANVAGSLVYLVAGVLVLSLGWGVAGLLVVLALRHTVVLTLLLRPLRIHYPQPRFSLKGGIHPALRRRILRYSRDAMLILLLNAILYERFEVLFLKWFATNADIAFYTIAFDLTIKLMSIPAMFSGVLLPTFSALNGAQAHATLARLYASANRIVAFIAIPIGLGGGALATGLASFYGPGFQPLALPLSIMLTLGSVGALASVSSSALYSVEKQFLIVRVGSLMAVINLILALILIPPLGALGAALANSISQTISGVVGIYYAVKLLEVEFPLNAILRIVLASLLAAASAWVTYASWRTYGGLLAAVAVAAGLYVVGLVRLQALSPADYDILAGLERYLPSPIAWGYARVLEFMRGDS